MCIGKDENEYAFVFPLTEYNDKSWNYRVTIIY